MTRKYTTHIATEKQQTFVSRLVKETRVARGITPAQAAEQAGVSRGTFYRWEGGRLGSPAVKLIAWLFGSGHHNAMYWRERALIAEGRLIAINLQLKGYQADRTSVESLTENELNDE
jgi:transcriptional regulator with XRE-family HTH domain